MNAERPLLVCLTATRNYGWCTKAFLEANSLWADYIIVVDQMSTDATRDVCSQYEKVILVDNENLEYSETIRCVLAINEARKIPGDKIFIYLAIDEVLTANATNTNDWKRMLNSARSQVGVIKWANLKPDGIHYVASNKGDGTPFWMARIFHDDGITPYNNEGLDMHTHCIPYPDQAEEFFINDFYILHLEGYHQQWSKDKQRFYQIVDFNKNGRSAVSLDRMYGAKKRKTEQIFSIPKEWLDFPFDLLSYVDTSTNRYFDSQVIDFIINRGGGYEKLNIWNKDFLDRNGLKDPRNWYHKMLHFYLNNTRDNRNEGNLLIRAIDKLLKSFV